jgi:hypothetical protein
MNPAQRHCGTWPVACLAAIAAWGGVACGDDAVVEEQPGAQPVRMIQARVSQYDLTQMFDLQAFGRPATNEQRSNAAAEVARRLEPVGQRAAATIATIDRLVGLSDTQRKKLEVAAESDLRRLTEKVMEARATYVGRILKMDPQIGGLDEAGRKELQQAQEDARRCRQLVQAAAGPDSLLAKVLVNTLDEEQAKHYATAMAGRAACRWRAVVAAGLAQIDEQAGFTQQQHDAVAALLLAEVPPADDEQPAKGPALMQVAQRLRAVGDEKLAAILDPRQRQVVALVAGQGEAPGREGFVPAGMGGGIIRPRAEPRAE